MASSETSNNKIPAQTTLAFIVGIPMKKSTRSDAWRPPVPIDDDQMAWVHGDTVGCIC
jgi:hypothetical protein